MVEDDLPPRPAVTGYVQRFCPGATVEPLAGDASTRRFFRVQDPKGPTRVLMDYGSPFEGDTDDVRLAGLFRKAGLRVAEILAVVPDVGCLVLEDLGDALLETELTVVEPAERSALLLQAVELAAEVARRGSPVLAASDRALGPALDAERFKFEMEFFLEHYACALRGLSAIAELLRTELHALAKRAADSPWRVLCHRDYHSRNLIVLDDGELAMVDIQDARWGPGTYDLASLLRDAYVDIDEAAIEGLIRRYLNVLGHAPSYDEFRHRFDVVAAQRMIKALGTFGYQIAVLGRDRYASAVPRTLDRLRRLLPSRPETRPLHAALDSAGLLD